MPEKDIAPEIVTDVLKEFKRRVSESEICKNVLKKIEEGKGGYSDANLFSVESGTILSEALQKHVTSDRLPDGRLYYNIAEKLLSDTTDANHALVSDVSESVQELINIRSDIGVKARLPEKDKDRLNNLILKISGYTSFEEAKWLLGEPIVNMSMSVVNDFIETNANFQSNLGIESRITRFSEAKCCDYCDNLSGSYIYGKQPSGFFKQHERCRCVIEYKPFNQRKAIKYSKIKGQKMQTL